MKKILVASALWIFAGTSAIAAEETKLLPNGHTLILLSSTKQREVAQDLLVASLRFDKEARTPKEVQTAINTAMTSALENLKKNKSLKIETRQYHVYPMYTDSQVIKKWQGTQTIIIQSETSEDVLEASASLQEAGFIMNSLEYQLSAKKYDEIRDNLMEETIISLNERARRVANALNKTNVDLIEVNVGDQVSATPPIYTRDTGVAMMAAKAEATPPPVAEPGNSNVSLTISAKAIIKP